MSEESASPNSPTNQYSSPAIYYTGLGITGTKTGILTYKDGTLSFTLDDGQTNVFSIPKNDISKVSFPSGTVISIWLTNGQRYRFSLVPYGGHTFPKNDAMNAAWVAAGVGLVGSGVGRMAGNAALGVVGNAAFAMDELEMMNVGLKICQRWQAVLGAEISNVEDPKTGRGKGLLLGSLIVLGIALVMAIAIILFVLTSHKN